MELACLPTHRHKEGLRCTVLDVGQKRAQSSSREQGPCCTVFLCAGQRSTAETGQESEGPVRGPVLLVTVIQVTGTSVMQGPVLLLARRPLRITQASGALLQSLHPGLKCCTDLQELRGDTRGHFRVQAGFEFWKVIDIEKCKLIKSSNPSSYHKCIGFCTTNSHFSGYPFLSFSSHFHFWLLGTCWLIWCSQ